MNTVDRARRVRESGKIDLRRTRRRIDFSRRFLLFIPVETRRSRRALVVGYYMFFIAFVLVGFRGPAKYDRLLPLSFYLASMLGGLTFTGPVRVFSRWQSRLRGTRTEGALTGLLLFDQGANRGPRNPLPLDHLDEHDIALRNRAHYLAYAALRWPAILAALIGFTFMMDATPAQVAHLLLIASVPFAVLFFSLPQAIILWTQPDLEPDPVDDAPPSAIPSAPSGAHHA